MKNFLNDLSKNKPYSFFNFYVGTLFLNEYAQFKNKIKNKTKLKKTSVKTSLNQISSNKSYWFFNFCEDTLLLNEDPQLKKSFTFKKP